MKNVISSGGTSSDCLQREVDTCLLSRQLEKNETECDIAHDHVANDGVDENDGEDNDNWMEGVHNAAVANCVAEQDFDDANDVPTRWDRNHNFSQSHQDGVDPLNAQGADEKHKERLESERMINRRSVNKDTLNQRQKIAHDSMIKASKLNKGKSTTDGGHAVSRSQLFLGKGGSGKHTHWTQS